MKDTYSKISKAFDFDQQDIWLAKKQPNNRRHLDMGQPFKIFKLVTILTLLYLIYSRFDKLSYHLYGASTVFVQQRNNDFESDNNDPASDNKTDENQNAEPIIQSSNVHGNNSDYKHDKRGLVKYVNESKKYYTKFTKGNNQYPNEISKNCI